MNDSTTCQQCPHCPHCLQREIAAAYSRGRDEGFDWGYRQGYDRVAGPPPEENAGEVVTIKSAAEAAVRDALARVLAEMTGP